MAEVWLIPCNAPPSPREVALRLANYPGLAWLDGGLSHGRDGRFSFVATAPCALIERSTCKLERELTELACEPADQAPGSTQIDAPLSPAQIPAWVIHVAYDAHAPGPKAATPALRCARYDAWYAFDHASEQAYLVGDDRAACERLAERLRAAPVAALAYRAGPVETTAREVHARAIQGALALIRAGEVYEINLARRFRARFDGSALGLFLRMRDASPVPLGYYVEGDQHAVLGRSMERFLRYHAHDRRLVSSPIKGTVARAGDDAGEAHRLRSDPKERAEHAMVVDLMRNDLSRVCEVGSVEITELMAVLPFAGLAHLVSTVQGRVRPQVGLGELLAETFPPGSVTGAPKQRVLRAIAELEQLPRGVYTGCYGFIDRAGGCSLAVAIRTAVVSAGHVDYFAGGGIVADSDPDRELAETELKAEMFLRALAES